MTKMKNIFLLLLILSNALLFENCVIEPREESAKKFFAKFTGRWKLISSYDSSDSSFIGVAWINLQSDSLFDSNSSFFWHTDSLKHLPLHGRWSVDYVWASRYDDSPGGAFINFITDSSEKSWNARLNDSSDSIMYWFDKDHGYSRYTWKIL